VGGSYRKISGGKTHIKEHTENDEMFRHSGFTNIHPIPIAKDHSKH
jgi:hypothetical protein